MKTRLALAALALLACSSPPAAAPAAPTSPPADASATPPAASSAPVAEAPPPAPSASAKPAPQEDTGTPRERLMKAHFKEAAQVRTAVIDGSLAQALAPADALAKMDGLGKNIPAAWKPHVEQVQAASKRIAQSPDIPAAAAAIADIGVACGGCHRVSSGPKITVDPAPTADGTLALRMQRHVWATDRLWEGIYGPSDAAWKAGAETLAGADPFPKEVLDKGGVHARSAASRFKTLVGTAAAQKKAEDRAKTYASLLETCSTCHLAARPKK